MTPRMKSVVRFSGFFIGALVAASASSQAQLYFSQEERSSVIEFWSNPERYSTSPLADSASKGSWRVRLTTEGSKWLLDYTRLLQPAKVSPSQDAKPTSAGQQAWEAWLARKVAWDNWKAAQDAFEKNLSEGAASPDRPGAEPAQPGAMPADLAQKLPQPPAFASAVRPFQHRVSFGDGTVLNYQDNVAMRQRFAYYRFSEGVQSFGQRVREMDPQELRSMAREAGISDSDLKVLNSVSLLEGGFDSLNTYDTGYVSVGMIQFAALQGGAGSLGQVMLRMKQRSPEAFNAHFRKFGLEVTPRGELAALCPTSGAEFIGAQAAQKIIADKRLASVFQRAGRLSREFRVAQLMAAKDLYHPSADVIRVRGGGREWNIPVAQVFKSEAGIATLMDRKVNTGKLGSLDQIAGDLATRARLQRPEDLALLEYDLVMAMKYRKDYLSDPTLSKPKDWTVDGVLALKGAPMRGTVGSRSGSRTSRTGSVKAKIAKPAKVKAKARR